MERVRNRPGSQVLRAHCQRARTSQDRNRELGSPHRCCWSHSEGNVGGNLMSWLGRLFARKRLESDLEKELRFHFETQVAEKMRSGISESEARRLTRLEFGGIEQIKENCRESRGTLWIESLVQDVGYGLRQLRKSPGFTLIAILSLTLGIGASTAIFTLLNAILLRPLPVQSPSELLIFGGGDAEGSTSSVPDGRTNLFSYSFF